MSYLIYTTVFPFHAGDTQEVEATAQINSSNLKNTINKRTSIKLQAFALYVNIWT